MTNHIPILRRQDFVARYGAIYATVFGTWSRLASPFRSQNWEQVLIPNEPVLFDDETFAALGRAIDRVGDRVVMITIADSIPPHEDSAVVKWERLSVKGVHRGSLICVCHYAIFGESASWGVVGYHHEFTRVAGVAEFINTFTNALSGREAVKRRFLEFQAARWDAPKDVQEKILASVGWSAQSQN